MALYNALAPYDWRKVRLVGFSKKARTKGWPLFQDDHDPYNGMKKTDTPVHPELGWCGLRARFVVLRR